MSETHTLTGQQMSDYLSETEAILDMLEKNKLDYDFVMKILKLVLEGKHGVFDHKIEEELSIEGVQRCC